LLHIQPAGQPGNVRGQWVDDDSRQKILDERFATRSPFGRVRAVSAVNEFNDTGRGQSRLLIAGNIDDALEKGRHAVAAIPCGRPWNRNRAEAAANDRGVVLGGDTVC
jgi:hypothetical protein